MNYEHKFSFFIKIYYISASRKRSSHWECCYGIFIRELGFTMMYS